MKEPWKIYADESKFEIQRVKKAAAEDHRKVTLSELQNAEYVAAEACFYHLIEELNLKEWEAEEVVERFRSRLGGKGGIREKLRNEWTDWVLTKGRP